MTGIHSKAATKEYRDNWDRVFGNRRDVIEIATCDPKMKRELEKSGFVACANCAVDGQTCECDEAVCHVPEGATDCAKELMSGVDMMPVEDIK